MGVIRRIRGWSYQLHDIFLKNKQASRIATVKSNLLHSMIVDEKKRIFKKQSFVLKKGKLETFLVVFDECLMEIKLNSY